jgi:enoyl-CoA hydratase
MTERVRTTRPLAGVAVVTLSAPESRNAIDFDMADTLSSTFMRLDEDPGVRAVVVAAEGPAFCAGADRTVLADADEAALRRVYRAFTAARNLRVPTIAAVTGPAVGAGLNLALACDLRLAGTSARFDARFMTLGVHCGGGATWMLTQAVGTAVATAMLLFSEVVDGQDAERLGLAWQCLPDEDVAERALQLAERLAGTDRELAMLTKNSLRTAGRAADHAAALEVELERQVWSFLPLADREPWSWADPGVPARG